MRTKNRANAATGSTGTSGTEAINTDEKAHQNLEQRLQYDDAELA
jgi:hypothetical protein